MNVINIFFSNFFIFIYIYTAGAVFENIFFRQNCIKNLLEKFFIGVVFLSFISLLLNFFFPLNIFINSLTIIVISFLYLSKIKMALNIKFIYCSIFISSIATLILYKSNIYRPDAGLYHLPFIKILNDERIVFGLSNLHFRFGHISILQYISAHFNNYITNENAINIPTALISISFILYIFNEIKRNIKYNFFFLLCFFVFIFSVIYLDRYSDYGNDASGFIFAILTIISFIKYYLTKNTNYFYITSILALYCFLIKSFLIVFLIFPIFILNLKKLKKLLFDRKFFFIIIFLFLWLCKNIINTGCLIFPVPTLCVNSLEWTDIKNTKYYNNAGEAAAKGFLDLKDQNKLRFENSYEQFNNNFNWLSTWSEKHLKKIFEKNFFYIFLLFAYWLCYLFYIRKKIKVPFHYFNNIKKKVLFISFLGFLFWFLKFPLYRYGAVFIFLMITLLFLFYIKETNYYIKEIHIKHIIFTKFLLIIFIVININRIIKDYSNNDWPNIYKMGPPVNYKSIIINNKEIYTIADSECMYGKSLCTHLKLEDIEYKEKKNYKFFLKKS